MRNIREGKGKGVRGEREMEINECIHIFMKSAITNFPSAFLVHKL